MSDGYYDRQGRPVHDRAAQRELRKNKRVAETTIDDSWVSTVHLGLDHGYGDGPPVIFETMVFGGPLSDECEWYCTEAEALTGHAAMVVRVQKAHDVDVAIPSPEALLGGA